MKNKDFEKLFFSKTRDFLDEYASTQTTRIYAKPSLEMIKSAMDRSNPELNAEQPLWPDDEVELARIFGIR